MPPRLRTTRPRERQQRRVRPGEIATCTACRSARCARRARTDAHPLSLSAGGAAVRAARYVSALRRERPHPGGNRLDHRRKHGNREEPIALRAEQAAHGARYTPRKRPFASQSAGGTRHMTGPEYDAELEAFLNRRSMMHRRLSDIDHAEPSLEIDRLVLNRAREAIETPDQPLYSPPRWALPIGLAAAILIAFTVVLNLDHHGAKVASGASPAAAVAPQTPAPAVARAASVSERERIEQQRVVSDSVAKAQRRDAPSVATPAQRSTPLVASTGAAVSRGVLVAPSPPAVAAPPPPAA